MDEATNPELPLTSEIRIHLTWSNLKMGPASVVGNEMERFEEGRDSLPRPLHHYFSLAGSSSNFFMLSSKSCPWSGFTSGVDALNRFSN